MNVCACFLFMLTFAILDINVESAKSSQPKRFKDPSKYVKCSDNSKTFWPDYKDRKFYYECLGDDYYARRPCPPKKVFNYKKQQCIFPEINNISEHKSRKKNKFAPACLESSLNLFFPDPSNHRVYYKCIGVGKHQKLMCPLNEIFEFSVQMCVVEPDMEITTSTTPSNFQYNSIDQLPLCSIGDLHFAWPSTANPHIYYLCTGFGEYEVRECRYGSIFNFLKQFCEHDESRLTSSTSTSTTTTTTESTTTIPSTSITTTTTTTESPTSTEMLSSTELDTTTTITIVTSTLSPVIYPTKMKCVICWRPSCDVKELSLKWPDYDSPRNYFKCLRKNLMILRKCPVNYIFKFETQKCVLNQN